MKNRFVIEQKFMRLAVDEAEKAYALGEVPVGAVVVKDDEVVAAAHNLVEKMQDATMHAEMIALKKASKVLGTRRLNDCVLYVSLEPCAMCMGAIIGFRVGALCFGAFDPEAGCAVSRCELTTLVDRQTDFIGGVMEDECVKLLNRFFSELRNK
ncbi:MAG: nucleoside deaminase [Clostridia bacterium]|nr:nucleoside deaminase [Clostridia bacterium]